MASGLQIQINADVQPAINGLKQAESALTSFSNKIKATATSATALAKIPPIQPIPAAVPASFDKLKTSSSAATQTLINTGRVFQDLPFGILGVANNINPLVESFQRLSVAAKTTGTTISSQLLGALKGGGGLGIAISAVTAALTFATIGFSFFSRGASKAKQDADSAKDAIAGLAESLESEAIKITSLFGLIVNINTSRDEQAKALKEVNDQYGPYLKSLGIEEVNLGNLNKAYDVLINNLLKQAIVKGLQDEIAKKVKETAAEIIKLGLETEKLKLQGAPVLSEEQLKKVKQGYEEYKKSIASTGQLDKIIKPGTQALKDGTIAQIAANKELGEANEQLLTNDQRIEKLKNELIASIAPAANLASTLADLQIKVDPKKAKKEIDDFVAAFKFSGRAIDVPLEPLIDPPSFFERFKKELKKIQDFLVIPIKLEITGVTPKSKEVLDKKQLEADFQEALSKANSFNAKLDAAVKFDKISESIAGAAKAINEILTPAFDNLFTAILEGEDPLKAFFGSLIKSIEQLISKLLAAIAVAAILNAIFPGLGGAIGGGAKGFLGIFKGLLGFATGGMVSGPTLAAVGELSTVSNPEVIMPLDRLRGLIGGGGNNVNVEVAGVIRGNDLVLLNARTSRSQGRTMGR